MDLWLIFAAIFLLIGIVLSLLTVAIHPGREPVRSDFSGYNAQGAYENACDRWNRRKDSARGGKIISGIVLGFGAFLFAMSCWVQVPTNNIGIYTSFGKPVDAQPNGFQFKLPWEKVVKFDASRQYLKFNGRGNDKKADEDGKEFPCIRVKMEREASACVNVVVAWQLRAGTEAERKQSVELYRAHKTFIRLTENFMAANSRSATQGVYNEVNPLVPEKNPTFEAASKSLEAQLRALVSDEVSLISAQVVGIDYDDQTDKRIADMQAEVAKTEQAKQMELTNKAISAANKALVEEGKLTPEIIQAKCIEVAKEVGANPGVCLQPGWGGFGSVSAQQPTNK